MIKGGKENICRMIIYLKSLLVIDFYPEDCGLDQSLLDFVPIITCSGKRSWQVAREIANKGYWSTMSMFYCGLKIHVLCSRRIGKLPHPEQILFTPASVSDISVSKQAWSELEGRVYFGYKINLDFFLNNGMM